MPRNNKEVARHEGYSGIFIPAGLFIGLGIGLLVNFVAPWLFIGLGAGFLAMAISRLLKH